MTPRPGSVAADIPLSPPPMRDASWRLTAAFTEAAGKISAALGHAMAA
jgi:hypothetical protein